MPMHWDTQSDLPSRDYVCGHCGRDVSSAVGFNGNIPERGSTSTYRVASYLCHRCGKPTFFDRDNSQVPGPPFGRHVEKLPSDVAAVYDEARNCMKVNGYTAAVLCCRKLLMHLAHEKGAEEGRTFHEYVEYLSVAGYTPPDSKQRVHRIREMGNEANHEIKLMGRADAEELLTFIGMLLFFMYEGADEPATKAES